MKLKASQGYNRLMNALEIPLPIYKNFYITSK